MLPCMRTFMILMVHVDYFPSSKTSGYINGTTLAFLHYIVAGIVEDLGCSFVCQLCLLQISL